ncbi:MAG: hypothetical protein H7Y03_09055 [Chitinophagaceae bacterium]|nr:hypothetical protein [Chitinophagaceae bacterium]
MNIDEQWKNLDNKKDSELAALMNMPAIDKLVSKGPLEKIRRNLLFNIILSILIGVVYLLVIFAFPFWQIILTIGIVFLFTLWCGKEAFLLYREIKKEADNTSVLKEMERHIQNLNKWINVQQQVALFIYPWSAAGGFMLGASLGSGKSINAIMTKPIVLVAFFITIIILVPACFYLTRWLCKKSFGNYAEQLKNDIARLKAAE